MSITREKLIAKLERAYPKMGLRTTEEFDGSQGGIWTSGEESPLDRQGLELFDYYAENHKLYDLGVRTHFANFLERQGWYCEWHDAGTMMIWQG